MINNLDLILPFIESESQDDFWYLQILQRKKENKTLNSNSRVIKNYYIKNQDYLLDRWHEIKSLCDHFNARASFRLNKRSFRKVALKTMQILANTMSNSEYAFCRKSYDRAAGNTHNDPIKKWIVDVDEKLSQEDLDDICRCIEQCDPQVDKKVLTILPSKAGFHIISTPFNVMQFKEMNRYSSYKDLDISKDNPTNLYIP